MRVIKHQKIWTFDVDDTLVCWKLGDNNPMYITGPKGCTAAVVPHFENIKLLQKLAAVGWYIRVHSGSGWAWAKTVVEALGLEAYVDEVCSKPLGNTDDRPPGDGLAYNVYIDQISGEEIA